MNILYLGPPDTVSDVRKFLPSAARVHLALNEAEADSHLPNSDVILDAYMKVPFSKTRLEKASQLKLVITATTGADHIDEKYLSERKIPLWTLRTEKEFLKNITSAAEHSWLLLMACARKLKAASAAVDRGEWDRNQFPGLLLKGKTLGVVGCGRIGQWMATYAQAFGMISVGFDPHLKTWPPLIKSVSLIDLLKQSDFITLHVPGDSTTQNLIGTMEFSLMKKGVVVVNTSRGSVWDEKALLQSLKDGRVGAAGLDVLVDEPSIQQSPLVAYAKDHPNLIITPHIAGYTPETLGLVLRHSCERIKTFFSEGKP